MFISHVVFEAKYINGSLVIIKLHIYVQCHNIYEVSKTFLQTFVLQIISVTRISIITRHDRLNKAVQEM